MMQQQNSELSNHDLPPNLVALQKELKQQLHGYPSTQQSAQGYYP